MKKNTRRGFIYFRYIFPIAAAIIMVVLMFIPCYRYITADTGLNEAVSLWELMDNSWQTVREYLFVSGEKADVTLDFARTLLAVIVTLALLFIVGFASAVYAAVSAFRYFRDDCRESRTRILFITLVPNRIVLCIYHALMLPIFLLPTLMPVLYKNILAYHVELSISPFDMLFVALAVYAVCVVLVAVSANFEVLEQMNIFVKRRTFTDEAEEDDGEESVSDDPYAEMSREEKEEQTERIMRLLGKYGGEDKKEKEDEE